MLLPDITHLLDDPEIGGGQPFTIIRTTTVRSKGRIQSTVKQEIPATGSVQPAGVNALSQQPEGDRDNYTIIIRTVTPLQDGHPGNASDTLADEILYQGDRFKVLQTKCWAQWGMYVAYASKIEPPRIGGAE